MNKTTKGTIAAGAAVLLLLGTGGSLAYWNDSLDLGAESISAGQLKVTQQTAGWKRIPHGAATGEAVNPRAVKLVPGDKLQYTGVYNIAAEGRNLAFTVSLTDGSIAGATASAADQKLKELLQPTATFKVNNQNWVPGTAFTVSKDPASDGKKDHKVEITATLEWPLNGDPANDNAAQGGSVDIKGFALNIEQVAG